MADIQVTTGLDASLYTKGLATALKTAQAWRTNVERSLNFQPLKQMQVDIARLQRQFASQTLNPFQAVSENAPRARQATSEISAAVEEYRIKTLGLRAAIEGRSVSEEEGIRLARQFATEARAAAAGTGAWTKEQYQLLASAARAERTVSTLSGATSRLGLSQNQAIGTSRALALELGRLQQGFAVLLGAAGGAGFLRLLQGTAQESFTAATNMRFFRAELAAQGVSLESGEARLTAFADRFKASTADVAGSMAQLLLSGARLEDVFRLLEIGGASALKAGKSTAQGFEAISAATLTGNSRLLETIGLVRNLGPIYEAYAKSLGKTADELSGQERVLAAINGLYPEARREIEQLNTLLAGYGGSQSDVNKQLALFRQNLGEASKPLLTFANKGLATLLGAFNSLPGVIQSALSLLIASTVAVTTLAGAYSVLSVALLNQRVLGGTINTLVNTEIIARSRLGVALTGLATRYKLLSAAQLDQAKAARASALANATAGRSTGLLATGFGGILGGLKSLGAGLLRVSFNPITVGITLVLGLFKLFETAIKRNRDVMQPAFAAWGRAVNTVSDVFQPLIQRVQKFINVSGGMARLMDTVLVGAATTAAKAIVSLSDVIQQLVIVGRFLATDPFGGNLGEAFATMQADLRALEEQTDATRAEIDALAQGALPDVADKLDVGGRQAIFAVRNIALLREEAQGLAEDFDTRLNSLEISIGGNELRGELDGIREQFATLNDDLGELGEDLKDRWRDQFAGNEGALEAFVAGILGDREARLQALEQAANDAAIGNAISSFEREIADAQIDAIEGNQDRINAEYDQKIADTRKSYGDALAALEEGSAEYIRVLTLQEERLAQLEAERARGIAADAEAQLQRARDFYRQLADIEAELDRQDIGLITDATQRTNAEFEQQAREITERYRRMAEDVQGTDEEAAQQRVAIQQRLTEALINNEQQRNAALATLARERAEGALEAERQAADLEYQVAISRTEDARERLALERDRELAAIQADYDERIRAGNVTGVQLIALEREVAAKRTLAHQQYADAVEDIERESAERVKSILRDVARAEGDLELQRLEFEGNEEGVIEKQYQLQVQAAYDAYEQIRTAQETSADELRAAQAQLSVDLEQAAFERTRAITALEIGAVEEQVEALQALFERGVFSQSDEGDIAGAVAVLTRLRDSLVGVAGTQDAIKNLDAVIDKFTTGLASLTNVNAGLEQAKELLEGIAATELGNERARIDLLTDPAQQLKERYALETRLREEELAARIKDANETIKSEAVKQKTIADLTVAYAEEQRLAERQLTRDLRDEYERRADAIAATLGTAQTELERARIELIGAELPKLEATFALEARLRRDALNEQLADFEGSHAERQQLIETFNATELALTEGHNRELGEKRKDALEQYAEDVRDAYEKASAAVSDAVTDIANKVGEGVETLGSAGIAQAVAFVQAQLAELEGLGATDEATQPYIDLLEKLAEAGDEAAETEIRGKLEAVQVNLDYTDTLRQSAEAIDDEGRRLQARIAVAERELALRREAIRLNQEAAQLAAARGDREDQVGFLQAQKAAYEGQIGSIRAYISALEDERDAQLAIVNRGSTLLDYYRAIGEVTGQAGTAQFNRDVLSNLEQQRSVTLELLKDNIRNNGTMEERAQLAQKLADLNEQVIEAGGKGIQRGVMANIFGDARKELKGFPQDAQKALTTVEQLDASIVKLETSLQASITGLGLVATQLANIFGTPVEFEEPEAAEGEETMTVAERFKKQLEPLLIAAAQELGKVTGENFHVGLNAEIARQDPGEHLLPTIAETGEEVVERSLAIGTSAGAGLMGAFAQGVTNNKGLLLAAVEDVLQDVRDMLPSSDARRGPLSDLTKSGKTFFPTWLGGVAKTTPMLDDVIGGALKGTLPSSLALRTLPAMAGGTEINMNIDAKREFTPGHIAQTMTQVAQQALRELKIRGK